MPAMMSLTTMILNAYVAYLTEKLHTDIDESDPSRVSLVRIGRLQEDPTQSVTYVLLSPNDIEQENWRNEPSLAGTNTPFGLKGMFPGVGPLPTFEIGSSSMMWWRRFSAESAAFYLNEDYTLEEAQQYSSTMFHRLEHYIGEVNVDMSAGILGMVDDFDERVISVIPSSSRYRFGGGPPSDWIMRSALHFDVLTQKEWG